MPLPFKSSPVEKPTAEFLVDTRQCKRLTTPLGIGVVSSRDCPEPLGRQRTGTTWVVTMSTSLDIVLQSKCHCSPVGSQTKH